MQIKMDVGITISEQGRGKVSYDVGQDFEGQRTLSDLLLFLKKSLIVIADQVLKEEQAKGFDSNPIVAVDGVANKSVLDVKPLGKIEFFARQQMLNILPEIYEAIDTRSPIDSGLYKESNFVFLNGKQIASNMAELKAFLESKPKYKNGDVIRFMNVMPYASKLERFGVTRDRSKTRYLPAKDKRQRSGPNVRMPNGTYFLSARSVQRKYRFNSNIRFEWINGRAMDLSGVRNTDKKGRPLRRTFHPSSGRKGHYVYPTIVVRINEKGIF